MQENPALALVAVLSLGMAGQWLAWRSKLPSILVLLVLGFAAGPLLGVLHPDETLGDLLFPIVSLSASVILFEGGLSASWRQISRVAQPIRRLVTVGALITWFGASVAGRAILGLEWGLAILLGGILVVTGPTVIDPLIRHVRPTGSVGTIAKLEGIITDPIGALAAVLAFQALESGSAEAAFGAVVFDLVKSVVAGAGLGALGAGVVAVALKREWLPHRLAPAATLIIMLAAFVGANTISHESGLLAVTLMGVMLASTSPDDIRDTFEFTENLRAVLIGTLFILLSARVEIDAITQVPASFVGFAAALLLLVRPLAVAVSLYGTETSW
ncbi:MAG: cation:proton antiporter, partial [Myxococcota bacterium]